MDGLQWKTHFFNGYPGLQETTGKSVDTNLDDSDRISHYVIEFLDLTKFNIQFHIHNMS